MKTCCNSTLEPTFPPMRWPCTPMRPSPAKPAWSLSIKPSCQEGNEGGEKDDATHLEEAPHTCVVFCPPASPHPTELRGTSCVPLMSPDRMHTLPCPPYPPPPT
mmetsp:Transcript_38441/g.89360  ORF Transcript_38441/g.89360 Transcript_38441/m.89360 type:complete len:104 (-) Transcript_38441:297-608(-)